MKKNSHNPDWQFYTNFVVKEKAPVEISIEVFDENVGKDYALGKALINMDQIMENKKIVNQWILLTDCRSGEVLLSVEFAPDIDLNVVDESKGGTVTSMEG